MTSRRAFSLIEILVVLVIIGIIAGLAFSVPRGDKRESYVRGAAEELAAVMRETRARAMKSRAVYALAFNIQNAPGSDGRTLNNRTGGHWYRVLGPRGGQQTMNQQLGYAPIFDRYTAFAGNNGYLNYPKEQDNPVRPFLDAVASSWVGEARRLPPGKVRFLALTDEDRGHYRAPGDIFPPTYPRPWFGHWDDTAKRLYPWGGYEPELPMVNGGGFNGHWSDKDVPRTKSGRTISHTGFYYEGYDGVVTGCVNQVDRLVFDDTNNDGLVTFKPGDPEQDNLASMYRLWKAGDPRPLFNGDWGDFLLVFLPNGQVYPEWLPMRRAFTTYTWSGYCNDPTYGSNVVEDVDKPVAAGTYNITSMGPADRASRMVEPDVPGTHVKRTGFYWITIGPDVPKDEDTFPNVTSAIHSLMPAYRIGVSPFGEVRIIKVRSTTDNTGIIDTALSGADWNVRAKTDQYYQRGTYTNPDGSERGAGPIYDRVLPEMMLKRAWWWQ